MPPDRARSNNPQGRQKSCGECAKAKRKCDLGQPHCLRCTRQRLECTYPPLPPHAPSETTPETSDSSLLMFDVDNTQSGATTDVDVADFDLTAGLSSIDALNDMLSATPHPQVPGLQLSTLAKSISWDYLSSFTKSRIEYPIQKLKEAPKSMVWENSTAWSHPKLYEEFMPRSIQDAIAACALFNARNDTNADFVARHVIGRAKELMDAPMPTLPMEILARNQALILYQIMITFSDDIHYRGHAATMTHHLETAGNALYCLVSQFTDPVEPLPLYPSAAARSAWSEYIFRESSRRTTLIIYNLKSMSSIFVCNLSPCSHQLKYGFRIALSAKLWVAPSAFDFAVAWNGEDHLFVEDLEFDGLKCAKADNIDAFGRMVMVSLMGIDDVRGWFYMRGLEWEDIK
ncbi:hypothetical protein BS50DRAFT_569647 [Corynespora cassiicola Philippines]|uniref:Zn(2)-C6 fungal-type domain-containing protein n=1 Tax=Corynespora cassiicola Philippines TaxID=1448308 RepID=A0A2T2P347_CORCC|nr:hypothetical protein BS50DRAFT_569647 [Corynespora cassiicola Philippines]